MLSGIEIVIDEEMWAERKGTHTEKHTRGPVLSLMISLVVVNLYTKQKLSYMVVGNVFDAKVLRRPTKNGRNDGCKPVYPLLFQRGSITLHIH